MSSISNLVSIVVPVYNVRDYLRECLESIAAQTYQNIEVIMVDDGSTDGTSEICDEYDRGDERYRVVHTENCGLSSARNLGIKFCKGSYYCLVDGDDVVDVDFVLKMVSALEESESDLAICQYSRKYELSKVDRLSYTCYSNSEATVKLSDDDDTRYTIACNKMYRRAVLPALNYPIGKSFEDCYIIHHILDKCSRVVEIPDVLYYWREREGSISYRRSTVLLAEIDYLKALLERSIFYSKKLNLFATKKAIMHLIKYAKYCFIRLSLSDQEDGKKISYEIRKQLTEALPRMIKTPGIPIRSRVEMIILAIVPAFLVVTIVRKLKDR